jgi:tetratricopeptide (TPR) repeat protein
LIRSENAHNSWGLALDKQQKYNDAIARYLEVVAINPNNADAYTNWGLTLEHQGKYDEAIVKLQKAIALDIKTINARRYWSEALRKQGKLDEAAEKFKQVLEIQPGNKDAMSALSSIADQRNSIGTETLFLKRP